MLKAEHRLQFWGILVLFSFSLVSSFFRLWAQWEKVTLSGWAQPLVGDSLDPSRAGAVS